MPVDKDKESENESLKSEEEFSLSNKNTVPRSIKQLLTFLVFQHSEYLDALSSSCEKGKKSRTDAEGCAENLYFAELKLMQEDINTVKDIIKAVHSECNEVFEMEEQDEKKCLNDSAKKDFYKKLYCLVGGVTSNRSKRYQKQKCCRSVTSQCNFGQSTCSVEERVSELEAQLKQKEATLSKYKNESDECQAKITKLEENLKETEEALNEIATEYTNLVAEIERQKRAVAFKQLMQLNNSSTPSTKNVQSPPAEFEETPTSPNTGIQVITEESASSAEQSLFHVPTNAIERELHNIYKLLLLQISQRLLQADKAKFKDWAASTYSVQVYGDAYQTLVELDKRGIISSSNLSVLKDFFQSILRIDLECIIDGFLAGDYTILRTTQSERKISTRANVVTTTAERPTNAVIRDQAVSDRSMPRVAVEDVIVLNEHGFGSKVANEQSLQTTAGATVVVENTRSTGSKFNDNHQARGGDDNITSDVQEQPNEDRGLLGANDQSPWLCDHYKRQCLVKFNCCERYWPCHRCHNNKSKCGRKKLKSRDIRLIKCVQCEKEQMFNENSQFCSGCGIKFAEYFCAKCQHLTGMDDKPYHCDKCGICRIHGDRSFHCDTCGVCLDVQLRNNHKCRAGSAHDECCICLEDAFTGCQILPCSHKVHKECSTQMIRNGITRCPICRQSFAHKLQRPTSKMSRKHHGRK